jgi:hypothetical protein
MIMGKLRVSNTSLLLKKFYHAVLEIRAFNWERPLPQGMNGGLVSKLTLVDRNSLLLKLNNPCETFIIFF